MPRAWRRCSTRMPRPFARTGCCGRCGISSHARRSIRWMANSPWPVDAMVLGSYTPASRLNSGPTAAWGSACLCYRCQAGATGSPGGEYQRRLRLWLQCHGAGDGSCKLPIVFIVNNNSGIVGANLALPVWDYQRGTGSVSRPTPRISATTKSSRPLAVIPNTWCTPDDIRPALVRAYQATKQGQVACVNVLADPQESMATRSQRAGALMGYGRE